MILKIVGIGKSDQCLLQLVLINMNSGPEKGKKATLTPFGLFKHLNVNEVPSSLSGMTTILVFPCDFK